MRSEWLIGYNFRRALGGMPRAHQLKEDSDYVSLIAGTKRKAGIRMYRHVSDLGFKFVLLRSAGADPQDTLFAARCLPNVEP